MGDVSITSTVVGTVNVDVNQDNLPDQVEIVKLNFFELETASPKQPPIEKGPLIKEDPDIRVVLRNDTYLAVGNIKINQGNGTYKDLAALNSFQTLKKNEQYKDTLAIHQRTVRGDFYHSTSRSWHVESSGTPFNKEGKKVCNQLGVAFWTHLEEKQPFRLIPFQFYEVGINICLTGKGAHNIRLTP